MRTLTFMFADLREYTTFVERHGDVAAAALVRDYRALVRAEVAATGGAEIKTEGDSFFVVFESAGDALRCATAILRRAEAHSSVHPERPLRIGIGLHSGEPQPQDDQYVGVAVIIAARLAQQADAGEILMTEVVRSLLPKESAPRSRERHGLTLKGIADPPRVHAVAWAAEPDAPHAPDPLVGRDEELTLIAEALARPTARLVTLVGPGGVGKSRLATAAAQRCAGRFPDGTIFVDLAPLRDHDLVPAALAAALGVAEISARPLTRTLLDALRDREILLVFDNFEQVLDAAAFVATLCAECPRLRAIVTSRRPLRIRDEHVIVVPPLATDPAVALFLARSRAAGAPPPTPEDAPALAEICHRLDRLPLAIELAAARSRQLAPRALLARLERSLPLLDHGPQDAPARQRTLTAAIAWSYELLDERSRAVFRACAVFAGGFTPEAVAAVSAAAGDPAGALDQLATLVDHSLVVPEAAPDARSRMLETIREFGLERLAEEGEEEAVRRAHAMFFGSFVMRAVPHLEQADQSEWLDRLTRESANIRAALVWSGEAGEPEWGLRLAAELWPFWFMRGALGEARQMIAGLLERAPADMDVSARAGALNAAGTLARYQRDYSAAEDLIGKALEIRRGAGDEKGTADSLNNLAYVTLHRGDHVRARQLYEEALVTYRRRGDLQGIADAVSHLSLIALQERDLAVAFDLQDESLRIWRDLGDLQGVAWALEGGGKIALESGDRETAVARFREGLEVARALGHRWAIALLIDGFACVAAADGHAERALRLAGAAAAMRKRAGTPLAPMHERQLHRWLERARHALSVRRAADAYASGALLADEAAIDEALTETPMMVLKDEWCGLSEREREVAALLAQGLTNKQIAERLFIAAGTADRHVANILGKLDMRNRAQVAAWVAERGLLPQV